MDASGIGMEAAVERPHPEHATNSGLQSSKATSLETGETFVI